MLLPSVEMHGRWWVSVFLRKKRYDSKINSAILEYWCMSLAQRSRRRCGREKCYVTWEPKSRPRWKIECVSQPRLESARRISRRELPGIERQIVHVNGVPRGRISIIKLNMNPQQFQSCCLRLRRQ